MQDKDDGNNFKEYWYCLRLLEEQMEESACGLFIYTIQVHIYWLSLETYLVKTAPVLKDRIKTFLEELV